ncbi:PorV/PorQ family protein [candidate division KSB1 bacterium]|nr:PorV/PorQ family protein [candidate division KSB1 bacterium]
MQKKYLFTLLILFFLIWTSQALSQIDEEFADFNRAGKTIYNFLRVEQGARAVGMGGAYTPISDDINSIFYNPAGLTHIESMEYVFSYADWLVGSKFFSGAFGYTTGFGTLGISFIHFGIEEFEETLPLQPEGTGRMVGAGNLALGLAYAREITDKLSLGGQVRYIQETLDQDTRTTVSFDLSTFYNTGFRNLRLGVALRNLGPDQAVSKVTRSESFPMPIDFNVTVASEILGKKEGPYSLTLAFENGFTVDLGDRYRLGAELWLMNLLALRGGYRFNYSNEDFSFGFGISPKLMGRKLNIDMAYTNFIDYFDSPLRISVSGTL